MQTPKDGTKKAIRWDNKSHEKPTRRPLLLPFRNGRCRGDATLTRTWPTACRRYPMRLYITQTPEDGTVSDNIRYKSPDDGVCFCSYEIEKVGGYATLL